MPVHTNIPVDECLSAADDILNQYIEELTAITYAHNFLKNLHPGSSAALYADFLRVIQALQHLQT